jgi:hypothetical protein
LAFRVLTRDGTGGSGKDNVQAEMHMAGKGRFFSEGEVNRIVWLLASTEMSIPEIARRMHCSVSAVGSINRKLGVRNYAGRRGTWEKALETVGSQP